MAAAPVAGDLVEYQLFVTNNGPSDAQGVTAAILLPAGLKYTSATTEPLESPSGTYTFTIGTLSAGATRSARGRVGACRTVIGELPGSVVPAVHRGTDEMA